MSESKPNTKTAWIDPDDAPELTAEWFDGATMHEAGVVKRLAGHRGPGKKPAKELVSIRLDPEILAHFREAGDGWQTRLNDTLKKAIMAGKRKRFGRVRMERSEKVLRPSKRRA